MATSKETSSTSFSASPLETVKTYDISRRGKLSPRHLRISHGDNAIYNVHVESSDSPAITLERADSESEECASAVKQSRHSYDMELLVGNADAPSGTPVTLREGEGGSMDPYYTFTVAGSWYAWHNTCLNLVRVKTADGAEVKTYGNRDWRLVSLASSSEHPKRDENVLAVYIEKEESWKRPQAANVHWITDLHGDTEVASLIVLVGILDRKRRSSKEYRSGTALLYT